MKKGEVKIQYGIKSCSDCEQNIRCTECYYNQQSIEYWQKQATESVYNKLESMLAYYNDDDTFTKEFILERLLEIINDSNHTINKNESKIKSAIHQFEENGIDYKLKNEPIGQFHCWRKSDNKLFQFYAGTGKIVGIDDKRGIRALIEILKE